MRAVLIAVSTASAPEFIGSTISLPVSSRQPLGEGAQLVVVEGAAGQREPVHLRLGRIDQPRMSVAEVERGVGRQQVEVPLAIDVGDPGTLAVGEHDGQWVVVVGAVALDLFAWIHGRSLAPEPRDRITWRRNHAMG